MAQGVFECNLHLGGMVRLTGVEPAIFIHFIQA